MFAGVIAPFRKTSGLARWILVAGIVTHRGPSSAQRHEPHYQAIADYRCTLISEEPIYRMNVI